MAAGVGAGEHGDGGHGDARNFGSLTASPKFALQFSLAVSASGEDGGRGEGGRYKPRAIGPGWSHQYCVNTIYIYNMQYTIFTIYNTPILTIKNNPNFNN